jgi:hypothetical protein
MQISMKTSLVTTTNPHRHRGQQEKLQDEQDGLHCRTECRTGFKTTRICHRIFQDKQDSLQDGKTRKKW